VNLLIRNHAKT